jgi:CubicO group peptidase (beta-lactamase class C family)
MFPLLLAALSLPGLDDSVRASMQKNHVPGAVVAIVERGQPPVVRAYGLADVAGKRAVDPNTSAFRNGSVSKVMTATAVLQLVEQGKLDLNADVNGYVDFTIPPFEGMPVTLAQLLTHTAGFDDKYVGKSARTFEQAMPLGAFVKRFLPRRIAPPGEIFTYSNYGVALAGYIVERTSGQPFAQYVQEKVFQPLGMEWSTFVLPDRIREQAAIPYEWTGSEWRAQPWDYLQDSPAGMQMSSGADMARFLAWALEHPERDEFKQHFSQNARLEGGIGWVWELGRVRGHDFVGHDGGYSGARARLRVFQEDGIGYFIAENSGSDAFLSEVSGAIDRRILPEPPVPAMVKPQKWDRDVARFAGVYRDTRYPRDSLLKVGVLLDFLGGELTIGTTPEGLITIPRWDGTPRRMAQIEPGLFQSLDDDYLCAFSPDASYLFTSGTTPMEHVRWWLAAPNQRWVFVVTAFALALLVVGPIRRRLLPEPLRTPANWTVNAYALHGAGVGLVLQVLTPAAERNGGYMYGFPWPIWVVQSLGVLGAACAAWFLYQLFKARPRVAMPWLIAIVMVVYTAWLWNWRLLGYWF